MPERFSTFPMPGGAASRNGFMHISGQLGTPQKSDPRGGCMREMGNPAWGLTPRQGIHCDRAHRARSWR